MNSYEPVLRGGLDCIKYLLTSPELIEKGIPLANINFQNDFGFQLACKYGHLDIVRYLLTSSDIIEAGHKLADIHTGNDSGFRTAAAAGQLDVVKYLLAAPDLKEYANVHGYWDGGFKNACANNHTHIIEYLIFEYKISFTDDIQKYLNRNIKAEAALQMFNRRTLNSNLEHNLSDNKMLIKKMKI